MSNSPPGDAAINFINERDAPPVEAQPRMEVHSWRLIRAPAGTLHLVTLRDLSDERGTVRVTSAITAVNRDARVMTTESGRRYALMGPPEERSFEHDLLQRGAVRLGMGDAVDVSGLAWGHVDLV